MAMQTRKIVNGVRVDRLFDTIGAIRETPGLARYQFRGENRWINGAHNQTRIQEFYGAGQEDRSRGEAYLFDAGEPPVLLGENEGATPVEMALTALAGCLTSSLVYHAAARGIELQKRRAASAGRATSSTLRHFSPAAAPTSTSSRPTKATACAPPMARAVIASPR
jgi:organic hydroperoxide reductase OsmC/OhrA